MIRTVNVARALGARGRTRTSSVNAARNLQTFMTGSTSASWPCFPSSCTGSSSSGTRGGRVLECSAAAVVTLLLSDPLGSFHVRSCRSHMLSDWYTMLFNPSPDYIHTIHCTQEAVFPLYTIVFIYYAFCLVLMMVVRPFLVKRLAGSLGKADRFQSIYAALYFLPILTLVQAVSAGLLYFAFPFILLVFSIVTCAVYFALMKIVNIQTLFSNKRNLIVLLSHWVVHTYGIISITRLESLKSDLPMLALVPGPALFYLLTAKFTDPERIHSELNAG
uniref:JNK1/MAPK8-associated membrane protein isoform X4 n=1 Tax=Petromyzon marinus TaxID=7757 RepID=A0AAJ7SR43_PETMA|nr:JNK1/MAPK8-associated membrane protein isoform X4 [Petromyzon marinus]XP_032803997.1 JNK1/MAPK8-associated membrane protein isoform X4 [Petromyzon marinus]